RRSPTSTACPTICSCWRGRPTADAIRCGSRAPTVRTDPGTRLPSGGLSGRRRTPMTDRPRQSSERTDDEQAPELHNSEQDDEQWQTQTVAEDALDGDARDPSPLDSVKNR